MNTGSLIFECFHIVCFWTISIFWDSIYRDSKHSICHFRESMTPIQRLQRNYCFSAPEEACERILPRLSYHYWVIIFGHFHSSLHSMFHRSKNLVGLGCNPLILNSMQIFTKGVNSSLSFLSSHCSKSSFFVQKFNFNYPRKLPMFLG